MSTEITLAQDNPTKINKLFGFEGRPKPLIPLLKISGEDEEKGVTPPKGSFVYDDGDRVLHSKAIMIRVFTQGYQYRLWDNEDKSKTDASIIAKSFREEFRSMSGRIACGKLSTKVALAMGDNMTAQQKYFQDKVKCKLIVFGLVSGTFVDMDTNAQVDVEDLPFMWNMGQSGFMDTVNVIKGIEKERRAVPQTPIAVGLAKKKQGAVTYFTPAYTVTTQVAPMVAARDLPFLAEITKYINDTNAVVNQRYSAAVAGMAQNTNFAEVDAVVNSTMNDPLDF